MYRREPEGLLHRIRAEEIGLKRVQAGVGVVVELWTREWRYSYGMSRKERALKASWKKAGSERDQDEDSVAG